MTIIALGDRLKSLREGRKLRQDQVAAVIGVSSCTLSQYESGMRQPSYDILICMARLFHVTTDYLLGVSDARTVTVSGLSDQEIDVILELVELLSRKGK